AAAHIERMVQEKDEQKAGRVRLSSPDGIASFWLAPRLNHFFASNPRVSLSIDAGIWPNHPVRDELHVSLQFHAEAPEDFVIVPLATVHYLGYASKEYLEANGWPSSPKEYLAHRVLSHSAQQHQPETWDRRGAAVQALVENAFDTNCSASL